MSSIDTERENKQYGLSKSLYYQLAQFVYLDGETHQDDPVSAYNRWAAKTGHKFDEIEAVALILEYIRRLQKCDRKELKRALTLDNVMV